MKPSPLCYAAATLALLAAPASSADWFTVSPWVSPMLITRAGASGGINVFFLHSGIESFRIDATSPGNHVPILSYAVQTDGNPDPGEVFHFADAFTLSVLLSFPSGDTQTLIFDGYVSGTASLYRCSLNIRLELQSGVGSEAATFAVGGKTYHVSNIQAGPPPLINDTQNPGVVSALFTQGDLATGIASVSVEPNRVPVGGGVIGTVTLNKRAPNPGVLVHLIRPFRPPYETPQTVLVPGGASSAIFPVVALLDGETAIMAEFNGSTKSAVLDIIPNLQGDANRNGIVEISDAVLTLRICAGLAPDPK